MMKYTIPAGKMSIKVDTVASVPLNEPNFPSLRAPRSNPVLQHPKASGLPRHYVSRNDEFIG